MFRAAVPKTAVNEDDEFVFWEGKVRFPEKRRVTTPTGDLVLPEQSDEDEFGIPVVSRQFQCHEQRIPGCVFQTR